MQDLTNSSDWERVVIVHSRNGTNWAPTRALLSAHSGYNNLAWDEIENTLTTEQIKAGKAKDPQHVKNKDHPKVYVAWSKHPNFATMDTDWNDPASQSLDNAFRIDDWWHFVDAKNYIRADNSTVAGKAIGKADWGSASSDPVSVQDEVCGSK